MSPKNQANDIEDDNGCYNLSPSLQVDGSVMKKVKMDQNISQDTFEEANITISNEITSEVKEMGIENSQVLDKTGLPDGEDAVDVLLRNIRLTPITERYLRPSRPGQR